jgi:phosphonate transport system substrate-binding protein
MSRSLAVISLSLALALAPPAQADEPPAPLGFGIAHPYSAEIAAADATMLEGYLSSALRRPVKARTFEDYDQLSAALARREVDFAWITPLSYVKATRQAEVYAIAKTLRRGLYYRGVVFVRASSRAKSLAELKGTRVAWVDTGSGSGYLFPRALLLREGQKLDAFFASERFAGDHKAACTSVLAGDADAGATFAGGDEVSGWTAGGCVETLGEAEASKLRVVAVSDRIPNEVIAARAGFDEGIAGQLAGIFANLSETDAGRSLLAKVFRADGFGLALEQDFDPVRQALLSVEAGKWLDSRGRESARASVGKADGSQAPAAKKAAAKEKAAPKEKPAPKAPKKK